MSVSTPLLQAVLVGDRAAVERLLAEGAAVDERDRASDTPLHHAAAQGSCEIVSLLLGAGADVNARNWDDETPLLAVVADGARLHDLMKQLIRAGADVNIPDSSGVTPLMWAVTTKDAAAVILLIEAGAQLDVHDAEGDDIWDYARDEVVYSEEVYLALLAGKELQRVAS